MTKTHLVTKEYIQDQMNNVTKIRKNRINSYYAQRRY